MTDQGVVVGRRVFFFSHGSTLDRFAQWLVTSFKNKLSGTVFGISVSVIVEPDRRDDL